MKNSFAQYHRFRRFLPGFHRDVRDDQIFLERLAEDECFAGRINNHTAAVENKFIMAADEIGVTDKRPGLARPFSQKLLPFLELTHIIRRTGNIDEKARAAFDLFLINASHDPDILADRHAPNMAAQTKNNVIVPRGKIALLVEYAIIRQLFLVINTFHPAIRNDRGGVVQVFVFIDIDEPDDSGDPFDLTGQQIQGFDVVAHEMFFKEQIFRRVTADGQFWKNHDIRVLNAGALDILDDSLAVAGKIADGL